MKSRATTRRSPRVIHHVPTPRAARRSKVTLVENKGLVNQPSGSVASSGVTSANMGVALLGGWSASVPPSSLGRATLLLGVLQGLDGLLVPVVRDDHGDGLVVSANLGVDPLLGVVEQVADVPSGFRAPHD